MALVKAITKGLQSDRCRAVACDSQPVHLMAESPSWLSLTCGLKHSAGLNPPGARGSSRSSLETAPVVDLYVNFHLYARRGATT